MVSCRGDAEDVNTQTAYGAAWSTPSRTAAAVRAVGSRHGLELLPASEADLGAAAVVAHLWCVAHNVNSVSDTRGMLLSQSRPLAGAIALACGQAEATYGEEVGNPVTPNDDLLDASEVAAQWLEDNCDSYDEAYEKVLACLLQDSGSRSAGAAAAWEAVNI